jgi:hypothetical protein
VRLEIVQLTPTYIRPQNTGVFLQWDILNPTENIEKVRVEISGSPEGPFVLLVDNLTTFNFFDNVRDVPDLEEGEELRPIHFYSLHRAPYYRVTATTITGKELSDIKPVLNSLPKRQLLLRRKMHRDMSTGFKFNGIPLAILKKKKWGINCDECFDPITRTVLASKCQTCFSTGFKGGFYTPVHISGRLSVKNVQSQLTPQGYSDVGQKQLTILNYPIVSPGDIVAEINNNSRYIIKHVTRTELKTVPVHQRLLVSELARDAIEYQYQVDITHSPKMY